VPVARAANDPLPSPNNEYPLTITEQRIPDNLREGGAQVHNVDALWLVLYHQLRVLAVDQRIEVSTLSRSRSRSN
jgi:hypothetical protein